jgi:hypothetical protein
MLKRVYTPGGDSKRAGTQSMDDTGPGNIIAGRHYWYLPKR